MPRKKPRHKKTPSLKKKATSQEMVPVSKKQVKWCFELFDKNITWHEDDYTEETFRTVAKNMKKYSSMTWGAIENNRHRNHSVKAHKIIPQAQKRLVELMLDDYDDIWRFRFDGLKRIWGIRDKHIFRVLWWDPQHKICPSTPR